MGVLEDDAGLSTKWLLAVLIAATVGSAARLSTSMPIPERFWVYASHPRPSPSTEHCLGLSATLLKRIYIS